MAADSIYANQGGGDYDHQKTVSFQIIWRLFFHDIWRHRLDSRPRTLPSEKVTTQARIGIGYSDEEWHPVVRLPPSMSMQ